MSTLSIKGGIPLKGEIKIDGNKNASLPVVAASLLASSPVTLHNVPPIRDIKRYLGFFDAVNIKYEYDEATYTLKIDPKLPNNTMQIDYKPLTEMRASLFLMIPLLLKTNKIVYKGAITGCSLGYRPMDVFFKNLERFGAKVEIKQDGYYVTLDKPAGSFIWQAETSVSSTEAAIMVAVLSKGKTIIYNAASEPHVQDLCNFLIKMGANINGVGSNRLEIIGVDSLQGTDFFIGDDHHELATWLGLSAITKGDIKVYHNIDPINHLTHIFNTFDMLGVKIESEKIGDDPNKKMYVSYVKEVTGKIRPVKTASMIRTIKVAPWPGFPVDLLPLMIPIAIYGDMPVIFHNWMYEAGLNWVSEVSKAGVKIVQADPHRVVVFPSSTLRPAKFEAPHIIRATVALTMLALSIRGESQVVNIDTIERAHPGFLNKLASVGAQII